MKRWYRIASVLGMLMIIPLLSTSTAWARMVVESSDLAPGARAAILMDVQSGRILYAKNEDEELPIASVTKIMTAIIAIEHNSIHDIVKIEPNAVGVEGSSIYLKEGERIPLGTLLYGLMLRSGNDAATAIAEHVGGSVDGFVYLMNEKAEHLGLKHTHFANPHGLDNKDHYSTARDLAIISAYALRNPIFKKIVKTKTVNVPWPGEEWNRTFLNKNKLLRLYEWADGVKTGFTKIARRTLVSSATKDGQQLVAVTLNDGDDWRDSMNMFNYGFANYKLASVLQKDQLIVDPHIMTKDEHHLQVVAGNKFLYPLTEEERTQISVKPIIIYPMKKVQREKIEVGRASIYLNQQQIGTVPLITQYAPEPSFFSNLKQVWMYILEQGEQG